MSKEKPIEPTIPMNRSKKFRHCKPMISIDATHLYDKYKGKLMIAMVIDANNKIYPLAFVVVEIESTETWGWFWLA